MYSPIPIPKNRRVWYCFLITFWSKTHKGNILGTCQFLGTTMLIFKKFMIRATFYIFIISPYDVSEKSYSDLKSRLKTSKTRILHFQKISTWPLHILELTVVRCLSYMNQPLYLQIPPWIPILGFFRGVSVTGGNFFGTFS